MAQGRNLLSDTQPRGRNLLADEIPTPSNIEEEQPDLSFDPFKIPETAAYSAVAGAFTPEILKGASKVAGVFPQTRAMAPMLDVMGEAAKGKRTTGAIVGGGLGGAGETSAQGVKALGGGPVLQETARLATEVLVPAGITAVGRNLPITRDFLRDITEGGYKDATRRFAESLRGGASAQARESQEQVIAALEREAAFLRAQGKAQADQIVSAAEREAAMLAPTNAQQAAQIRQAARDRANNILGDIDRQIRFKRAALSRTRGVISEAERIPTGARALIGEPREATEVGTALRDRITQVQGERLAAREAQIKADKQKVAQQVQAKESAGNFVENTPQYKAILRDLEERLGIGKAGAAAPLKAERDQGIRNGLQLLYDSLKPRKVQLEDGSVVLRPTSFDAVDNVRRRLGEAYRNPTAEGYGAIGQGFQKNYYQELSEVLGNYATAKKELIGNYENLSRELDIFKTGAGQKATAVERFDPDVFKTYASALPANYFANRESVRDLIELVGGDRRFVEQQAANFVARQLEGIKTPSAAANWEMANRDWLVEFPGLQGSVNRYLQALGFAERRIPRTEAVAKALKTELPKIPQVAQKQASEVVKAAEKEAAALERPGAELIGGVRQSAREIQAAANVKANLLSSLKKDPVVAFDDLIRGGNTDRLRAAAPVINSDPELRQQFLEGLRISISRINPAEMEDKYLREIQPAMLNLGFINERQAKQIADQVRLIELTVNPNLKIQALGSAIRNAVVGSAGALTSRGMDALGLSLGDRILGIE
jgi:hypothetical protein